MFISIYIFQGSGLILSFAFDTAIHLENKVHIYCCASAPNMTRTTPYGITNNGAKQVLGFDPPESEFLEKNSTGNWRIREDIP